MIYKWNDNFENLIGLIRSIRDKINLESECILYYDSSNYLFLTFKFYEATEFESLK